MIALMTDIRTLAEKMRADWNRRIDHDYRFWMSDGHLSDEIMWETGERDLSMLIDGILLPEQKSVLEVGCGVGRLLRPAAARFKRVVGIDVSDVAIQHAKELLRDKGVINNSIQLLVGNGSDLREIADRSIDVACSFAALTSMPTTVIANYLREFHRVLDCAGVARIQMYLGKAHRVLEGDTLHLRCYDSGCFSKACELAGFEVEWISDLNLPFQVSLEEKGIKAVLVSLKRNDREPHSCDEISRALLPEGEVQESEIVDPEAFYIAGLEHLMALKYAEELSTRGEIERARAAINYAASLARPRSVQVCELLDRIVDS